MKLRVRTFLIGAIFQVLVAPSITLAGPEPLLRRAEAPAALSARELVDSPYPDDQPEWETWTEDQRSIARESWRELSADERSALIERFHRMNLSPEPVSPTAARLEIEIEVPLFLSETGEAPGLETDSTGVAHSAPTYSESHIEEPRSAPLPSDSPLSGLRDRIEAASTPAERSAVAATLTEWVTARREILEANRQARAGMRYHWDPETRFERWTAAQITDPVFQAVGHQIALARSSGTFDDLRRAWIEAEAIESRWNHAEAQYAEEIAFRNVIRTELASFRNGDELADRITSYLEGIQARQTLLLDLESRTGLEANASPAQHMRRMSREDAARYQEAIQELLRLNRAMDTTLWAVSSGSRVPVSRTGRWMRLRAALGLSSFVGAGTSLIALSSSGHLGLLDPGVLASAFAFLSGSLLATISTENIDESVLARVEAHRRAQLSVVELDRIVQRLMPTPCNEAPGDAGSGLFR